VFLSERAAMAAIKAHQISPGDVLVLIGAVRWAPDGGDVSDYERAAAPAVRQHVAVITDARFSGVSTGACVGHISPEALAADPSADCATAT
jgi:dihydroxyacid dehydratase/phosphogluconate dehydratase